MSDPSDLSNLSTRSHHTVSRRAVLAVGAAGAVSAGGLGGATAAHAAPTEIALDRTTTFQTWDGFGCSFAAPMQYVGTDPAFYGNRHSMLVRLFDTNPHWGIGLDIARLHIGAYSQSQVGGGPSTLWSHWQEENGPFQWNQDQGQVWAAHKAMERNPNVKFLAAAWSPPYWMKTNDSARGIVDGVEGHLKQAYYDDFATYLAEYVKNYDSVHGITIDYLSLINEPRQVAEYVGSVFTISEYLELAKAVGEKFAQEGLPTSILGPEEAGLTKSEETTNALHADPDAWQHIDRLNAHCYGDPVKSKWRGYDHYAKPFWMTERTEYDATLANALDVGERIFWFLQSEHNARAYLYWLGVDFPSRNDLTGKVALMGADEAGNFATNKKYEVLGQYSKFIQPGFVRVAATPANSTDFFVTAFTNQQGTGAVLVLVNRGTSSVTKKITGLQGSNLEHWRTSATEDGVKVGWLIINQYGQAWVEVPPDSVTTVVELSN